jgi:hypothetical protein
MTKCAITCAYPGCTEKIFYDTKEDKVVPIYCSRHRTKFGRHADTRQVYEGNGKFKPLVEKPPVIVILRCPSCKARVEMPQSQWLKAEKQTECVCGKNRLIYHKDKHDPEDYP